MRLENDKENMEEFDNKVNVGFAGAIMIALFVLTIVGVILFVNRDALNLLNKKPAPEVQEVKEPDDLDGLVSGSTLTSDDLDIWEDYPKEEPAEEETVIPGSATYEEDKEEDPSEGGTKTEVKLSDGTVKWYPISPYIPECPYKDEMFSTSNGRMAYYEDGKVVSYTGVDISQNNDYVDFNKVKKDGIDYVMLRVGSRGYSSGVISIDENFYDNAQRAGQAGLDIGVIFFSQAISEAEAIEEADFVYNTLNGVDVKYPVVYQMDYVPNDVSRIDKLTVENKTKIAAAFLNRINERSKAEGATGRYIPMLYADKEWAFTSINYLSLWSYDLYYENLSDMPNFPYRFHMWKYSKTGVVDGISGKVDLSISLIDYNLK